MSRLLLFCILVVAETVACAVYESDIPFTCGADQIVQVTPAGASLGGCGRMWVQIPANAVDRTIPMCLAPASLAVPDIPGMVRDGDACELRVAERRRAEGQSVVAFNVPVQVMTGSGIQVTPSEAIYTVGEPTAGVFDNWKVAVADQAPPSSFALWASMSSSGFFATFRPSNDPATPSNPSTNILCSPELVGPTNCQLPAWTLPACADPPTSVFDRPLISATEAAQPTAILLPGHLPTVLGGLLQPDTWFFGNTFNPGTNVWGDNWSQPPMTVVVPGPNMKAIRCRADGVPPDIKYTIDFSSCGDVAFEVSSLATLGPTLAVAAENGKCNDTAISIDVADGEVIGSLPANGTLPAMWRVADRRVNTHWANPSRFPSIWYLHAACPLNTASSGTVVPMPQYYSDATEQSIEQQVSDGAGHHPPPSELCDGLRYGSVARDATVFGDWFPVGAPIDTQKRWPGAIGLVYDVFDPTNVIVSLSSSGLDGVGGKSALPGAMAGQYVFPTKANFKTQVNSTLEDIRFSQSSPALWCFDVGQNRSSHSDPLSFVLQMPTNRTLKIEARPAPFSCASSQEDWAFSENAREFER